MKPIVLLILDGFGWRDDGPHNAIELARLSHYNGFLKNYPHSLLEASGEAVGLMPGVMGNSEVGHINLGAGRIVYQDLKRIFNAIGDGTFFENRELRSAMKACQENSHAALHLMGLLSDAGVHSHSRHLLALLELAKREGLARVFVHAFMDGRDTPPNSGVKYLQELAAAMQRVGVGQLATISGRYYAMDRDQRWERTERAFNAIVHGEGNRTSESALTVLKNFYQAQGDAPGFGDEFVPPTVFLEKKFGQPIATITEQDAVIFFNFRPDRARQLTQMILERGPQFSQYVCMALYNKDFDLPVAFPKQHLDKILPELIAEHGLSQFRLAETEKYAHVTYFFNGGEERVFKKEERKLIPSNREVGTYDLAPEMRAEPITEELVKATKKGAYDFYVVNLANPDMVGHTGKESAVVRALEIVDRCLGKISAAVLKKGGTLLITADHGNCEEMVDANGIPHTQHTLNPVPLLLVSDFYKEAQLKNGRLCDVAPTILQMLEIPQPEEMTGCPLLIL